MEAADNSRETSSCWQQITVYVPCLFILGGVYWVYLKGNFYVHRVLSSKAL